MSNLPERSAAILKDSMRLPVAGRMSASPTAAPAAPERHMTESSTHPWATMKLNNALPSPCRLVKANTAPSMSPFRPRMYKVPRPNTKPAQ
jgi:hypothetical protein